jgi:hypothetical protein
MENLIELKSFKIKGTWKKKMLPKKVNFMKTRKGSNNEIVKKKIQHKKLKKEMAREKKK